MAEVKTSVKTPDLHSFLEDYKQKEGSQVIEIDREITTAQEVTTIVRKLEREKKLPILIFNNVVHPNGHKAICPLVMNLMASRQRVAHAMNTTFEKVGLEYFQRARLHKQKPVVISREEAPVKQVIRKGEDVNLFDFPAMMHFNMDPGPYLSGGFLTTYDPETGVDNTSLQRGWIIEKNKIRCYLTKFSHNNLNFNKYEAEGKDMPVAYWIGHHPLAYLGGQAKLGYPESHFEAMGGLLGEPLRMVPSETLGDDFLIPADAEVVIEGYLKAGARYPEGPFGEYTGYTGPQIPNPQMEVTAITYRRNPYWMNILVGGADNHWGSYAMEAVLYEAVKARVPSLQHIYLPMSGMARFHAYMQFKNPKPGDAREAMMVALTTDSRLKHVFAFDDDINIFDEAECLFALATRSQWDQDIMIFPNTRSIGLDPSTSGNLTTKGGIDCTKPPGKAYAERNLIDKETEQRIEVADFISEELINQIRSENL